MKGRNEEDSKRPKDDITKEIIQETSPRERREVESRIFPNATIVYEAIRLEGEEELARPAAALFWSGLAAGLCMGFSLIAQALLQSHLPDTQWRPLIVRIGYTVGFLIAVLGRQQLFTEDTVTPILPLLLKKNLQTLRLVARLWAIVLLANLIGALLIAWALGCGYLFLGQLQESFSSLAHEQMRGTWGEFFAGGILSGWAIALMVWLLPAAGNGRIAVIMLMTYIIGLGNMSHVVAGSVEVLYLTTTGQLPWWQYLGGYMLPTLIGNVLGGVALVAGMGHAQAIPGKRPK